MGSTSIISTYLYIYRVSIYYPWYSVYVYIYICTYGSEGSGTLLRSFAGYWASVASQGSFEGFLDRKQLYKGSWKGFSNQRFYARAWGWGLHYHPNTLYIVPQTEIPNLNPENLLPESHHTQTWKEVSYRTSIYIYMYPKSHTQFNKLTYIYMCIYIYRYKYAISSITKYFLGL